MTWEQRIAHFIGEVSRPLSILFASIAGSIASVIAAQRIENGNDGAILLAAVFAGVGTLFLGKSWEIAKGSKHKAEVEVAKAKGE